MIRRFGCGIPGCPVCCPIAAIIPIRDQLLSELSDQQRRRAEYPDCTWIEAEIDVMHRAVNRQRGECSLPDLDRAAIARVERQACGHSDYSSKFALYCAELVQQPWLPCVHPRWKTYSAPPRSTDHFPPRFATLRSLDREFSVDEHQTHLSSYLDVIRSLFGCRATFPTSASRYRGALGDRHD